MNALAIIEKYYKKDSELYAVLVRHSVDVMNKAVCIIQKHPELNADIEFVKEAAMLHDIGIFMTYAPTIHCSGIAPYLCHGYLGSDLLMKEELPKHALVCERHTGTGLGMEEIVMQKLPLPHRDMRPKSIEEQIICFADCFYSKSKLDKEKSIEEVEVKLARFGEGSIYQFREWCNLFL